MTNVLHLSVGNTIRVSVQETYGEKRHVLYSKQTNKNVLHFGSHKKTDLHPQTLVTKPVCLTIYKHQRKA